MSIIIRLQNLPWAANSVDIRRYFDGLSIPDGGVHIVGGEKGDAFIAFSTDEDARQAMERDGGKIKEIKIKLLLSSRAEMQRVIEQARNQNVSMQVASSSPTVKAAASDSDRRKVPEKAPSPPRKKDKEKSPTGPSSSGRERRKTKWDRSRSRSRSPVRRSRDRERERDRGDTDRRDRSKRDDRRSDDSRRDDRLKSSKDNIRSQDPRRPPVPNGGAPSGFDPSGQTMDSRTAIMSSNVQSTRLDPRSVPHGQDSKYDSNRQMLNQRSGQPPFFESPLPPPPNQPSGTSSFGSRNQPPQEQNIPDLFESRIFPNQSSYSQTTYPSRGMPSEPGSLSYEDRQPLLSQTVHPQNFENKHNLTNQPNDQINQFDKRGPNNSTMPYDKNFDKRSASNSQTAGHLSPMRSKQNSFQSSSIFDNRSNIEGGMNYDKSGPISQMPPDSNMPVPYDKKTVSQGQIPGRNLPFDNKRPMNNQMQNPPFDKRPPPPNQSSNMPSQFPKRPMQSSNQFTNEDMPGPGRDPFLPALGTGALWQRNHPPENKRGPWDEGRRTLLAPPVPDNIDRYGSMHTPDDPQEMPMDRSIPPPKTFKMEDDDSYLPPPFDMPPSDKRRMPNRGNSNVDTYDQSYPPHNQRPDNRMHNFNYDDMPPRRGKDSLMGRPRHPGGLLDRDELPSSSLKSGPHLYVELHGLPFDATVGLVRQFLHGLSIAPEGIKILPDEQGASTAFVKFLNEYDVNNAMKRNMQHIGNNCIEVTWCPESVFNNVPRSGPPSKKVFPSGPGYSRQLKPRMEDLCLLLKNLPYSCREDNIVNFFDGLSILDVCIEYDHNGKGLGTAFVEFGNPDDFHMALSMNGNTIGHRYIDVSVASKEMMRNSRREGDAPIIPMSDMGSQKDHPPPRHLLPPQAPGGRPPLCIALHKLPLHITDHDISDFFGEVGLIPRAIHIMLGPNKLPSGEAFAEFGTPQEIDCALKKNGQMIGDTNVSVTPIPYIEMVDILGGPHNQPPPMPPQGLLENPPDEDERQPRRPLMRPPNKGRGLIDVPEPMHFEPMDMDDSRGPRENILPLDPEGPLMDIDRRQDRLPPEDMIEPLMGNRQMMPRMGGPRGFMRPPLGMGRPPRPMPGDRAPRMPFHGRFRPPYQDRMRPGLDCLGPEKFGKPGCVLALSNVHYNAGLEELLEFFGDYGLTKENLIRKYNEKGQPTGEARVSFKSPEDAQKALKELNMKTLMGRSVAMVLM